MHFIIAGRASVEEAEEFEEIVQNHIVVQRLINKK